MRARVHLHQGQLDDVFRWAEPAAAMSEDPQWRTIHSEALRLLGDAARRRGDLAQAEELYRRCTVLLDRLDNPHGVAASFWGMADILRQRGDWEGAKELLARSRLLYEEIGDAHGLADFLIGLGDLGRQRLRLTSAEEYYGQALGLFERLGNQYGVARSWNGLGEVARLRGQAGAAAASYRRAHKILDGLRSADEVVPRLNLALLDLAGGRLDAAGDQLEAARLRLELLGWQSLLACTLINLLPCTAHARRWTVWDEQLEEGAAALAAAGLFDPDLAWSAELAGDLADAAGEPARAHAVLRLALAQRRGLGHREEAGRLAAALARLQ